MRDSTIRAIFRMLISPRGRRFLHGYQDRLLRRQVAYAATRSPFYRRKFAEAGFDPRVVRSAADLPKLGFFTHPTDLQADPFAFLAAAKRDILYAMASSGTTGEPKIVFFTVQDWEIAVRTVANGFALMGVTRDDVAQILFCFGTPAWMTGNLVQSGLERLGVFVLPVGNAQPIHRQIETMRRFGTTMLLGTPTYLHRLTDEGAALADLRSLGVRLIRLGAEPFSEELRRHLADAWGAEVVDSYGMMELGSAGAAECRALSGLHLSPYLLVEAVHPQTGAPVPRGELGELVFTTLVRRGSPLLRYRSGDLGRLLPDEPCPCGELPTDRISRIVGRADDMLFLGSGENIFPAQVEAALLAVRGLVGFQVVIDKVGYRDRLLVRAETAAPVETLRQEIERSLYAGIPFLEYEIRQSQTVAPLEVELLPPGALQGETPIKVRRLVDRRNSMALWFGHGRGV